MKRIQDFLMCDTINDSSISSKKMEAAVSIKDGNFHWGLNNESPKSVKDILGKSDEIKEPLISE